MTRFEMPGVLKIALLLLLLASTGTANAAVTHAIGIARASAEDEIRYIEHHQYLPDGTHRIAYYDPALNLLLSKALSYEGKPQHPAVQQLDHKASDQISIVTSERSARMTGSLQPETPYTFELADDVVIDAGFDGFIRAAWAQLMTGSKQQIRMIVAGVPAMLKMTLKLDGQTDGFTRFSITPANLLLRLALPGVQLTYDNNRRLVQYKGPSNLSRQPGDSREVTINFSHHESEFASPTLLAEWLPGDNRSALAGSPDKSMACQSRPSDPLMQCERNTHPANLQ